MTATSIPWKRVAVGVLLVAEVAVLAVVAWTAKGGPTVGIAVRSTDAAIAMSDQRDIVHNITVDSVTAPADSWIVVQADANGTPGTMLGSVWVPKGQSTNLRIELDSTAKIPPAIFVTLLADKGMSHQLEYGAASAPSGQPGMAAAPGASGMSATGDKDVPVIAGDRLVQVHAALSQLSFAVGPSQASLSEATRTANATDVVIPKVVAPAQSWVSVSVATTGGQPGASLGQTLVKAGETTGVIVRLGGPRGSIPLVATLHVDLGALGEFQYLPGDRANSPDQPYVAGGETVSTPIRLVK